MATDDSKLREWMRAEGVWQLDLCNLLFNNGVLTKSDFRNLDRDTFDELLGAAKQRGFMGEKKLTAIYTGKAIKSKPKKKAQPKPAAKSQKPSGPSQQQKMESVEKMLKKGDCYVPQLRDLMVKNYNICSVDDLRAMDSDEWDEFLSAARLKAGLVGPKLAALKNLYRPGSVKKASKKKKPSPASSAPKKASVDPKVNRAKQRDKAEAYLRSNDVYIPKLADLLTEYGATNQNELRSLDGDDFGDLIGRARLEAGLVGPKLSKFESMYTGKKIVAKKKKPAAKPAKKAPAKKNAAEDKSAVISRLDDWLRKENCWVKDLPSILYANGVRSQADFGALDRDEFDEVLTQAKQGGLMGQKVKVFKTLYQKS